MLCKELKIMVFPNLEYNTAGLPPTIQFTSENFICPPTTKIIGHVFYMQTMKPELETTDMTRQNK